MYIKVTTYRIRKAETHGLRTKTHVHKITNVLASYMGLGINYFDVGTSITRVKGMGPENLEFFGPKNASANGFGWIKSSRPGPMPYKQQVH